MSGLQSETAYDLVELVAREVDRAMQVHPSMKSPHEAYAVILEELDEFWELVRAKQPDRLDMRKELIQTAAMCLRAIVDLDLR